MFSQLYLCPYIYGHTDKFPPPFPCKYEKAFISLSENMNLPIQKCVAEKTLHNNSSMILAPLVYIITSIMRVLYSLLHTVPYSLTNETALGTESIACF